MARFFPLVEQLPFGVGKDREQWVDYLDLHLLEIQQLMKLTRNKRRFYQQGIRAATLIASIF
jgi:hypothetical protein